MSGSFFGLHVGLSALLAQQRAMDVTGHNIANANTPGFSRQRVAMAARPPLGGASMNQGAQGYYGTGVDAGQALRLRDSLLDHRYRSVHATLGEWQTRQGVLDQVQHALSEPSDIGIGAAFDRFWSAIQDTGNNPESVASRRAMIEAGDSLADTVNQAHRTLETIRTSLDELLRAAVGTVNSVLEQLEEVNRLVFQATVQNDSANDLMDRRDLLLDQLSGLIGTTVQQERSGDVTVFCGSHRILDVTGARRIEIDIDPGSGAVSLTWADSGSPFVPVTGEMKGLLVAREEYLPDLITKLEDMVSSFVDRFNEVHREGFGLDGIDGRDFFFAGGTAGTLRLNPAVALDPTQVALSRSGEVGDNANALLLSDVRFERIIGGTTVDDFFNSIVSGLGIQVQRADGVVEANRNTQQSIQIKREAISGVSLDEEVTNLLRYQHAYSAAARFISVMDEMLDTLINRMGR